MTDDTDTTETDTEDRVADSPPEDDIADATTEGSDSESEQDDDDTDTFTRDYVEALRRENGKYRQRAQQGDEYAHRLHTELVRATGKLADPTDLAFNEDHLADPETLTAAVDELLTRKPHLGARRPVGEIGQGLSPAAGTVDLAAILRNKAG